MGTSQADGFTNKLDERWTLSPLLVLREGKADGFTNKLDERWTLLTLHDDLKIPSLLYFS